MAERQVNPSRTPMIDGSVFGGHVTDPIRSIRCQPAQSRTVRFPELNGRTLPPRSPVNLLRRTDLHAAV